MPSAPGPKSRRPSAWRARKNAKASAAAAADDKRAPPAQASALQVGDRAWIEGGGQRLEGALVERSLELLGDATGPEADVLRERLDELGRKYALFGEVFDKLLPGLEGPIDLERLVRKIPRDVIKSLAGLVQSAVSLGKRLRPR